MIEKRRKTRKPKLTDKQRRFIAEYLRDQNALQAAIRAGYKPNSAAGNANRIMKNPLVACEIKRRIEKQIERTELKADEILRRINEIALEAEKKKDRRNALRALELLGKHLRLFPTAREHAVPGNVEVYFHITDLDDPRPKPPSDKQRQCG